MCAWECVCVCGCTKLAYLRTVVKRLLLTHSLAAAASKMFSFLPFIFDLLTGIKPHSLQAAYLVIHVAANNRLGVTGL